MKFELLDVQLDYELLLTKMKRLNSLNLCFKRSHSTLETLNQCVLILNYCNELRSLTINGSFNGDHLTSFAERLVEQVKLNQN